MRTFLASLVLFVFAMPSVGAVAANVPPAPTAFVTDQSHVLSANTVTALTTQLHAYQEKSGHQVIVYIAPSTNGEPLEDFTSEAGHQWHVGQKGKDDGAILFLFTKDHRVRIEVGYGLESVLTDAKSKEIIDSQIIPSMKSGNTDAAVQNGVNGILATLGGQSTSEQTSNSDSGDELVGLIVLFLILAIIIGIIVLAVRALKHAKPGTFSGTTSAIATTSSSSWWSSGSSSSGDSGFSFSGGGGDFGGGGASGSW